MPSSSTVRRRIATALSLGVLCAAFVVRSNRVPAPVAASAPATVFSAERAMRHVGAIAERPHPIGSEDHARVRSYLLAELAGLGLTPHVQDATGVGTRYPVSGRVQNVLARIPGTRPGGLAVLLVAHYDGVPAAPAAADDAAGSAVLLETIRALRAGPRLEHDVIALITDGEEIGLLGAAAFAREHPWAKDVGVVLNIEARGTRGRSLMFETGPGNLDVVRVLRTVRDVSATSLSTAVYRQLPNDTDLSELAILERPALNFAFIGGVDRYHTAEDDVAHLSVGSVQHHGNHALALARAFGNGPLPQPRTPDAVFFDVPMLGLIVYPESWALPLAVLAAALVLAALVRARKNNKRWIRDPALGALGSIVAMLLAGASGIGAVLALRRVHAALAGGGVAESSGVYAVAIVLLALALAAACYAVVRRWAGAAGAHAGALVVWAILSTFVAWSQPGMSFVFTWPLLAAVVPALVNRSRGDAISEGLVWIATLVTIALLVPTLYTGVCLALGLGGPGAGVLAGLVAFAAWLLAPQLESLTGEWRSSTPVVAGIAALALFTLGMTTVRTDAEHPSPSSLTYVVDADSGSAWLTGAAAPGPASSWLRAALGPSARTLEDSAAPAWLARLFGGGLVAPAPHLPLVALAASVLGDSVARGERRITLHIRAAPQALAVGMSTDSGVVLAAAVDGRTVDTTRYRRASTRWSLTYAAPSDSGFTLILTLRPSARLSLDLTGRIAGIPALPRVRIPPRPPGVVPIGWGDWTLVYRRVEF